MNKRKKMISIIVTICIMVTMFRVMTTVDAAASIINNSSTSNSTLNNVAFGNGIFLATSVNGNISKSIDGINWSTIATNIPKFSKLVFGGNGNFTAIDGTTNTIYTSQDGITWSSNIISIIPQGLKEVNGRFFVWRSDYINGTNPPAYNTKLFSSTDGITWIDTNIVSTGGIMGMQTLSDITYGNGKYVVAAANATFYTSADLLHWTTVELDNIVNGLYGSMWPNIYNVTFLNGRFFSYSGGGTNVLMGNPVNKVLTSTDGSVWTVDSSWDNNRFYGGISVGSINVLYGEDGLIYNCNNSSAPISLSAWTTIDTKTSINYSNIVYGNGKYIAFATNGIETSSDLINWYNVNGNLKNIAYDGIGRYVSVANTAGSYGTFGSIYTTTDWTTWNDVTPFRIRGGINAITYGAGKFLAVTDKATDTNHTLVNALVLSSTNGTTWNVQDSGIKANLTGIAYNGTNTYAVVTNDGRAFSSIDGGATWIEQYNNSGYAFNTIAYLNNQFIAVGVKSLSTKAAIVIAKSPDGFNWGTPIEVTNDSKCNMMGIAYNGNKYIVVGVSSTTNKGAIYKSDDLTTWNNVTIDTLPLNSVSFGNGGFLAVGNGGTLLSSADGDNWVSENSNSTSIFTGITYANNHYSVVGKGFSKMQLTLPVINNSIITPTTGSFDKNILKQKDVDTYLTLNGNTLTSINNGAYTLLQGTDYKVSGNTVTINSSYLANQIVGTTNLTFNFSTGNSQTLSITVVNTTPPDDATFTPDITSLTNGNVKVTVNYPLDVVIKQYSLDGVNYSDYTGAITFSANGTLYAKSQDAAGNWSNVSHYDVTNIDKTAPLDATYTADITSLTNSNVKVTINYPADAFVKQYSLDGANYSDYTGAITFSANGTLYAKSQDAAGNWSNVSRYDVINIDKIAPLDATYTADITSLTSGNVKITVNYPADAVVKQYSLNGASYTDYTGAVTFSANGTLYAKSQDAAGNWSNVSRYDVINIDKIAPLDATYTADITSLTSGNVKVTVSYPADAVVKQYSLNGASYTDYTGAVTFSANGTLYAKSQDAAGNWSNVSSYDVTNIDNTAPNTAIIANKENYTDSKWYNVKQTISASFIPTAGCSENLQYKVDDAPWTTGESVDIDQEGKYTVSFRVLDDLGRASEVQTVKVNLDKTAPTNAKIIVKDRDFISFLNKVTFGIFFNATVNVSISADSNISGVNKIEYQKVSKESDYNPSGTWTNGSSFNVSPDEKFIVYARITDNADNYVIINSDGVIVDATTPALTLTPDANDWSTKNVNVVVAVSDGLSGVKDVTYTTDETIPQTGTVAIVNGEGTITLSNEGQYKLTVIAKDNSLNEITKNVNIKIDKTKPIITGADNSLSYFIGRVIKITDAFGEIDTSTYKINGDTESSFKNLDLFEKAGKYTLTLKDKAGNSDTLSFEIKAIPKVEDVVYTTDCKTLIHSIRAEFDKQNDLPEPYKTDTDNKIKALEGRYTQLDKEVMEIKAETSAIKEKVDKLSNGLNEFLILQKEIQDEYNKILGVTSTLTVEQKKALEKEAEYLKQQLMLHEVKSDVTVVGIDGTLFTSDIYLVVNSIKAEGASAGKFSSAAGSIESASKNISQLEGKVLLALYDISLFRDNIKIEPNGKVKVKIKIPDSLINKLGLDIVHIADDGTVTPMNANVEDGYLIFTTTHFSDYAIVGKIITKEIPKTGYPIDLTTLIATGIFLNFIGIVLIRREKRKRKRSL